jgi:hypothetical protein
MQYLNEAVIKLINEDVVGGKKLIENELYNRLGLMLEEKLKDFAPTIFTESQDYDGDGKVESSTKEWKDSRNKAIKKAKAEKGMKMESAEESDDDLLTEEYELLAEELESIVNEIEEETGEELTESEIEELADILLESMEKGPDEEEDYQDEEEDLEEDSEDEYEDEE